MEQNRCISLLGSTGSIGRQSLDVIAACGMRVAALTANRDVEQMEKQCRRFQPELAVMMDPEAAASLRLRLADTPIRVAEGMEGLLEAASLEAADTVLTAVVGIVGLRPTLAAIRAGKRIALANKETLVCAGELVSDAAAWSGSQVVPVDSEHSAIFQCLQGCQDRGEVRRLILTASGGPFWGWKGEDLAGVTVEQALAHPNWNMGAKISVDSATMMNKGLEFIEAMRLYHMPPEAAHTGGSATAVLNGANEEAVGQFLAGQLSFSGIAEQVAYAMAAVPAVQSPSLGDILDADQAAREAVRGHRPDTH